MANAYQTIRLIEDGDGIATLTLARADKHNAMNAQMIGELTEVASAIADSKTVRAVILASDGKSFCAGGDLNWMREQAEKSVEDRVAEGMTLATMLRALDDLPQPLIGKVQGNAFGGGVGMMCVCDHVIAVENAKFGLTETRLGLIPATIGPYVVRRLGEGPARRVFMNAKIFGADEALRLGLVSTVVDADTLDESVSVEARAYLNCAPGAVVDAKRFVKFLARSSEDPTAQSAVELAKRWQDDESRNGIAAFFEREDPPWKV